MMNHERSELREGAAGRREQGRRSPSVEIRIPPGCEARARWFYVGLLGLRELEEGWGGVRFTSTRDRRRPGGPGRKSAARPVDVGPGPLPVPDLEALIDQLCDVGRRVDDESDEHQRRACFWDPFGNRITLVQAPRH